MIDFEIVLPDGAGEERLTDPDGIRVVLKGGAPGRES
jgi:hypothetical protein